MIFNKLLKPRNYDPDYFSGQSLVKVFAIPGSLVVLDLYKFLECGMYDENVFLYHEEMIVGAKFSMMGYDSYVLLSEFYDHYHSVSVKKNIRSIIKLKLITFKSHYYLLRNYFEHSFFARILLVFLLPFSIVEAYFWSLFKKYKGDKIV
jgi:GT2 family glycosyltransferase